MEFDIDSKGRHFKCLCFAFEACINGFKYCRPVLILDETFLKRRHKGCLLAATAKDGLYLLCFAIVDSERYDNWHWFLSKLFVILTPGRDITFVTDWHGGLLKALAKSRESKEYLLTLFSRYAYAPTIELFNELFEEFKGRCGRSVQKFLEDLPNECWCNAYFQGKRYGEMCTNAAKSFNSWIGDKRYLFSTNLVDAIRVKLMDYCDSYSHSIYPVPSMWKSNVVLDNDVVLPPLCKKPVGRPRIERIHSKGKIKRIRYSRCEKMGTHNRKTCKEALL
ncbi:hypothetical protein ACSBR2_032769 [Camellia fascicularis]